MIITNLLLNMVVLTVHGAIPTNTPAFQQYAFELLLTNAQATAAKWHLDQSILTAKNATWFEAAAYPHGPTASIVFGNRYTFRTWDGDFPDYSDEAYYERAVFSFTTTYSGTATNEAGAALEHEAWIAANEQDLRRHRAVAEQWAHATNRLTIKKAQQIAESAMRSVCVPMEKAGVKRPIRSEQLKWADDYIREIRSDLDIPDTGPGTVTATPLTGGRWSVARPNPHPVRYVLPYYKFRWETQRSGGLPRSHAVCDLEVSGITTNVVYFFYHGPGLKLDVPTNYFQMLGLPSNAAFVKRRLTTPPTYEIYKP